MKCKLFVNDRSKDYIVVRSPQTPPLGYYTQTCNDLQSRDDLISDLISEGYSEEHPNV